MILNYNGISKVIVELPMFDAEIDEMFSEPLHDTELLSLEYCDVIEALEL